jgi:AcrR family transcriptional regulator
MSPRPAIDHIRKPQILRAAAEVITERGLAATRIADVAARAGTSAPAVLYWFDTREQLLTEALIADESEFAGQLHELLAPLASARAKLLTLLEKTTSDGDLSLWIELWARSLHDEESREQRRRLDLAWRERIAAVVREGQEAGEFAADLDADAFAVEFAALIDGLGVQVTLGDPDVPLGRMLDGCVAFAEARLGASLREELEEVAAE